MRPANFNFLALLIVIVQSLAFPAQASEPAATIVDVLTCSIKLKERDAIALLRSDWFRQAADAAEGFELVKPVQSEEICIKQAKVVGAFGVFMVVGQVCDNKHDALKNLFERQFSAVPATPLEPGKLFVGKSQSGEGVIYRGTATMPPKPMVGSREVAFLCARQMGGTQ